MITAILMIWMQGPDTALLTMMTVPAQMCSSMVQSYSAEPGTIRAVCTEDETAAKYYFMKSDCGDPIEYDPNMHDSGIETAQFACKKAPKS